MNEKQIAFWKVINDLSEIGVLEHVAIIGSWAEYLYEFLYEGFISNLKTKDVDVFYRNIRKPDIKLDLISLLEERGFMPERDGFGVTRFLFGTGYELEFLVPQRGAGQTLPYKVEPLGIEAEGLRFTIIEDEMIPVEVNNLRIYIPGPWAYVLHKLSINPNRKDKAHKDIDSIRFILAYFGGNEEFQTNLRRCYRTLGKGSKTTIDKVCKSHYINLDI